MDGELWRWVLFRFSKMGFPNIYGRPALKNDGTDPLTPKQELFVAEYLVDLNGTQAAIRAGYAPDSASVMASKLLVKSNVKAEVKRQYSAIYQSLGTKAQRVLSELVRLGFSDIRELFDRDGNLLDIKSLPDNIAASISSVEVVRRKGRYKTIDEDGNDADEFITKVRLWDKTKALSMLGKHFGLLKDVIEHTGPGGGPIEVQTTSNIQVDSLPLWLKQALVVVSSGKSISADLEERILREVGEKFIEVEYEVRSREQGGKVQGNGQNGKEQKQINQVNDGDEVMLLSSDNESISTTSYQFTRGSVTEWDTIGHSIEIIERDDKRKGRNYGKVEIGEL